VVRSDEAKHDVLNNVESCESWAGKYWTLAVLAHYGGELRDGESELSFLERLSAANGWDDKPRFFGVLAEVPELFVAVRCSANERFRRKDIDSLGGCQVSPLSLRKGGNQREMLLGFFVQITGMCKEYATTLSIHELAQPEEERASSGLSFETVLAEVIEWGTERFVNYAENARLKKARKEQITDREMVCLTSRAALLDMVRLRQDADEWIYTLGSERQRRACPLPFEQAATREAKECLVWRWDPQRDGGDWITETLEQYVNGVGAFVSSLVMVGQGGAGKSRLTHAIAQELCIGAGAGSYLYGKSLDALGILTFSGAVRRAGCVCITDADLRVARGAPLSSESFKSLFDVEEGGALQDTRYRPCQFTPGQHRLLAFNGDGSRIGNFMKEVRQYEVGDVIEALMNEGMSAARARARTTSADTQAVLRRVSWMLVRPGLTLVNEDLRQTLQVETASRAAAALARRRAHWAAQNSVA
jgi:hypothetical protein